ncbi:MAG: GMC oxidoreductase [Actinomycetota bacterium]|nr:GMC oxidoreductase [Actinomycetota bacterium]
MSVDGQHYTAVVVGSGFGGTMTALPLAAAFKRRGQGEKVLILERGTWWTTPVPTVQDKTVRAYDFLTRNGQPVQFWASADNFRGFVDLFTRCRRYKRNPDGLLELTNFGKRGLLGLSKNDGITILRACGVGGGSLVYANVTIQPPDFIFEDERWTTSWDRDTRNAYFELARKAIGEGVLLALHRRAGSPDPAPRRVNTGLSNIVTRSPRLNPRWIVAPDPNNPRGVKRIDPALSTDADEHNALWIDRARVFQSEMRELTNDFGTVDSSINDITPEPDVFSAGGHPQNYCERAGRCIVGCLPGARHTLNKQLMGAIFGTPRGGAAELPNLSIEALAEVDVVAARPEGGWEVRYVRRDPDDPTRTTATSVTADRVVLAAGCVGTNEILLRSKEQGTIPNLSDRVGDGFSTNGDYLAFLDGTRDKISLTRGPITTSFGHFSSSEADGGDPATFHTIEDNGIPRAFSELTGSGMALIQSLSKGRHPRPFIWIAIARFLLRRGWQNLRAYFRNYRTRQERFASEDEWTMQMMCVAAMGREASIGRFRLGRGRDTPLRVAREDGRQFLDDPIYREIEKSLERFARRLTDDGERHFINPFVGEAATALGGKSIGLSHPLGGCRMAASAAHGVVDEYGRVFDTSKSGDSPFHAGLYVADAARIPTALGVNPSLTIAALALRTADKIVEELPPTSPAPQP